MRIRVQKWGNSLALRIPKSFAVEMAIRQGAEVDLTLEEGRLVVTPLPHAGYPLDALLARVTPDNIHREIDTGRAVGDEVW
jgi:antitoxin MazE